jgi:methionine-rich copper-binding protein CopC
MRYMMRYTAILPVAALLTTAASGAAFAHAELKTSVPEKGANLKTAPTEVAIDFSEEVNPKLSHIVVLDAKGQHVDKGDSHVAADDAKHMSVDLQPLAAGIYKVVWTSVAADDGHKLSGNFKFTVAP